MAQVKRQKAKDNSMSPLEVSIPQTWGHLFEKEAFFYYPEKDAWRRRLCFTMMKWVTESAKEDYPLEIGQFCERYKIPYDTLLGWTKIYDDIKLHYDRMKWFIASHRKLGVMKRDLSGEYAYRDMHTYDPEWTAVDQYHNNLKKDIQNDNTTKVIVLSQLETGELVPISGKKDDQSGTP